ncbi:MAG: hypothetical protein K0Q68_3105 [Moraxellaceae bacterium]|jgi:hypothetical protein|nr:hypothetical protein [Moraxellaceae bacterium]
MAEDTDIFDTFKGQVMRGLVPGAQSNPEVIEAIATLMVRHLERFAPVRVYWHGIMGVAECQGRCFMIDKGPVIFEECGPLPPPFATLFGELACPTPGIRALRVAQMGLRVV